MKLPRDTGPAHVAIDPGNVESGWVLFRLAPRLPGGLAIVEFGKTENRRLRQAVVAKYRAGGGVLAIEMPRAQGMPASNELFETTVQIGRMLQVWGGTSWSYVHRGEVKAHVCGAANAKDPNVRAALIDHFGGKDYAIGGKRCPKCHGKGRIGGKKQPRPCPECPEHPGWLLPPGPLYKMAADAWHALAVAVFWAETRTMRRQLTATVRKEKARPVSTVNDGKPAGPLRPWKRKPKRSRGIPQE